MKFVLFGPELCLLLRVMFHCDDVPFFLLVFQLLEISDKKARLFLVVPDVHLDSVSKIKITKEL